MALFSQKETKVFQVFKARIELCFLKTGQTLLVAEINSMQVYQAILKK